MRARIEVMGRSLFSRRGITDENDKRQMEGEKGIERVAGMYNAFFER